MKHYLKKKRVYIEELCESSILFYYLFITMSLIIKEALKDSQVSLNIDTKKIDEAIEKEIAGVETKANEVMNTTATNFGAELIPTNVMTDGLEMIPVYSSLMSFLPGFQGNNMYTSEKKPIVGEADLMTQNTEWTTGTGITTPADNGPMTDSVLISQGQLKTTVSISKRELNYAVERNLEGLIRDRVNKTGARSFDSNILNGDSATAWNVNLDGGTPSGFGYLTVESGIRKVAIADTNVADCGVLDRSDFIKVKGLLDNGYAADLENLLRIMPQNVYDKCLDLDELITKDKSEYDTMRTGKFGRIFWIKVLVLRDFPSECQATGKVSSTPASNTVTSFGLVYTPAVQYGFGQPLEIEREVKAGLWMNLVATAELWATVVYDKAGLWKTVAMWVNVTI